MSKRLFIGNLARGISDQALAELFAPYGPVHKAEVVRGRGGKGRGFGYVELATDEGAVQAIAEVNGRELEGRALTVGEARRSPRRSRMEEADRQAGFRTGGGFRGGYRRDRR